MDTGRFYMAEHWLPPTIANRDDGSLALFVLSWSLHYDHSACGTRNNLAVSIIEPQNSPAEKDFFLGIDRRFKPLDMPLGMIESCPLFCEKSIRQERVELLSVDVTCTGLILLPLSCKTESHIAMCNSNVVIPKNMCKFRNVRYVLKHQVILYNG